MAIEPALGHVRRAQAGQGFGVAHDDATIHALLGDKQAACSALERAPTDGSQVLGFMRVEAGQYRTAP